MRITPKKTIVQAQRSKNRKSMPAPTNGGGSQEPRTAKSNCFTSIIEVARPPTIKHPQLPRWPLFQLTKRSVLVWLLNFFEYKNFLLTVKIALDACRSNASSGGSGSCDDVPTKTMHRNCLSQLNEFAPSVINSLRYLHNFEAGLPALEFEVFKLWVSVSLKYFFYPLLTLIRAAKNRVWTAPYCFCACSRGARRMPTRW